MRTLFTYAYNKYSESAKVISTEIGAKRIKHEGSNFKGNPRKTVINWGCSELPEEVMKCNILNRPEAVALCANKLRFFRHICEHSEARVPDWTNDRDVASEWLKEEGVVFARTKLTGHSGEGIVEMEGEEDLVKAPLYTRYVPKKHEYRVHIFNGEVFLTQRKALRKDVPNENPNWKVRNAKNGFIFARNEDIVVQEDVIKQSLLAFNSIKGLTFASCDTIYNEYRKKAYVLEINTASGLTGSTVDDYAKQFKELING